MRLARIRRDVGIGDIVDLVRRELLASAVAGIAGFHGIGPVGIRASRVLSIEVGMRPVAVAIVAGQTRQP